MSWPQRRLPGLFRDAADHKFPFGVFRDLTGDEQPAAASANFCISGTPPCLGRPKRSMPP